MARERTGASSFDEIAVGLSSGSISRSKALKLVGAALVGGLLASLPGIAQAAPVCSKQRPCPEGCTCRRLPKGGGRACIEDVFLLPFVNSCGECDRFPGTVCFVLRGSQLACAPPCPPG